MKKADNEPPTTFENCCCPKSSSQFTSAIGSYSCSSNINCTSKLRKEVQYPTALFVMRHSERIDDMFHGWYSSGEYTPFDLNMPSQLPIARPLADYRQDPMLTRTGSVIAQLMGRGLVCSASLPDVIYCSPALRCLQTAHFVSTATKTSLAIRVEPGLFENVDLYDSMPVLPTESQQLGLFNIDVAYKPMYTIEKIWSARETTDDYNKRLSTVLRRITATGEHFAGKSSKELNVLIIGHASTVDMAVGLLRVDPRFTTKTALQGIGLRIPYCATICLRPRAPGKPGEQSWEPELGLLPPISYTGFTNKPEYNFLLRA